MDVAAIFKFMEWFYYHVTRSNKIGQNMLCRLNTLLHGALQLYNFIFPQDALQERDSLREAVQKMTEEAGESSSTSSKKLAQLKQLVDEMQFELEETKQKNGVLQEQVCALKICFRMACYRNM